MARPGSDVAEQHRGRTHRWRLAAVLVVSGCGRIAFDPTRDGNLDTPPCEPRGVTVGRNHSCAIVLDGEVSCWGDNTYGQALPGGEITITMPARVVLPDVAVQVAAGHRFTCARLADGSTWCWGDGGMGQLGGMPGPGPALIDLGGQRATELGAGSSHACARRELDGAIACWGGNDTLQLGTQGPATSSSALVVAGTSGTQQLAVGHRHSCIADAQSQMRCWGRNSRGQAGGTAGTDHANAIAVSGIGSVAEVRARSAYSCAVETGGAVLCMGRNHLGQLGRGDYTSDPTPGIVIASGARGVQLGGGGALALRTDGAVACWGDIDCADPVDGVIERSSIARVSGGLDGVTELAAYYYHQCGIHTGRVVCWGSNDNAELGRGTRSVHSEPVPISLGSVTHVSSGFNRACAIAAGSLYCWGVGPLGDGRMSNARRPLGVSLGLPSLDGVAVGIHVCAWGGGVVRCFGENNHGQLGVPIGSRWELAAVTPNISGVSSVAAGAFHTCAITAGTVRCWGINDHGELGDGTTAGSVDPVQVIGVSGATKVAISTSPNASGYACAIAGTQLQCWGGNPDGQLGDGTTTDRPTAITVPIAGTVVDVAVGGTHTCALSSTGAVSCWGRNDRGQLGVGDNLDRLSAAQVTLPDPAIQVAAGYGGTCVRLSTGAVMCWGEGQYGGLGDGTLRDVNTPVPVPHLSGADHIARGVFGSCALRAGELACWGRGVMVPTGDTSTSIPMSPVLPCRN